MLEARVYRTGLVAVALAVIVCAFSLQDPPGTPGAQPNPGAAVFNAGEAYATMSTLAARAPQRRPGNRAPDREVAGYVAARLRSLGFAVATRRFGARTVAGKRTVENVTGTLAGQSSEKIVIVAPRDAGAEPAAGVSGTAVALELARLLSTQIQRHTIVIASVSASAGGAGSARLARDLPGPIDAVLVLGDLTSARVRQPVVVPWSGGPERAPAALRDTVTAALSAQARLTSAGPGLAGQILRQAFPVSPGAQAPFNASGAPAVLISRSSEQRPSAIQPRVPGARRAQEQALSAMGQALLQSVAGLDSAGELPRPAAYLVIDHKVLSAGPLRLLVLALILPVALALVDAGARARRRGQPLLPGIVPALAAAAAFALGALVVELAGLVGLPSGAPAGPVAAGTAPPPTGGVVVIALAFVVAVAALFLFGSRRRARRRHAGEPGAIAVLAMLCAAALAIWAFDPLAALLLLPALHLWIWLDAARGRCARALQLGLWSLGVAVPALALVFYGESYHLGVLEVAWNAALMIAGGQLAPAAVALWCVAWGCIVGVLELAWRPQRRPERRASPVAIATRGSSPATIAMPGARAASLPDAEPALRR